MVLLMCAFRACIVNYFKKFFMKKMKKVINFLTVFSILHKMFPKIDNKCMLLGHTLIRLIYIYIYMKKEKLYFIILNYTVNYTLHAKLFE